MNIVHIKSKEVKLSVENYELSFFKEDILTKRLPLVAIDSIFIYSNCTINTKDLVTLKDYEIDVAVLNESGRIKCRFVSDSNKYSILRYKQYIFCSKKSNRIYGLQWIARKMEGRVNYLKAYNINSTEWEKYRNYITHNIESDIQHINLKEAPAAKKYYRVINELLPKEYQFSKRTKRPATDIFNSLLNYVYALLYNLVEDAIIDAGLDPHIGLLHGLEKNKKALLFDMIEPYRPWAEQFIIDFVRTNKITAQNPMKDDNGIRISKTNKIILIKGWQEYIDIISRYQGKQMSKKNHIYHHAASLAKQIKKLRI